MAEGGASWAAVVGRLPARLLTFAATLACLAFAALIGATLDSTYRTHVPIKVAGYVFGYGADDPSSVDKLRTAINEQLEKLKTGIVKDNTAIVQNTSSKNGAGFQFDQIGGRCPDGEAVVGIQPMPSGEGSSLRFQCGKMPELKVP
jgi:hypothetical protein